MRAGSASRRRLDDFTFKADANRTTAGTVSPRSDESLLGGAGLQLSYVHTLSASTFVLPFGLVSVWRNFKNTIDLTATFNQTFGGAVVDMTTTGGRPWLN